MVDWGLIPEQIPQMDVQPMQEPPPPFSMASGSDPSFRNTRFYTMDQGQPREYLPPTGPVTQPYQPQVQSSPYILDPNQQYATQGSIQPMQPSPQMQQMQGQSPYAVQQYQPVQYNYPQWLDDPKSKQLQQDIYYGGGQGFVQAFPRNGKKDGASVWADSIAPVVGQVLGGRQLGSFLQNQAIANRQAKFQQQQQAISALNASTNFLGTFAIRPMQKQADAENRSREKNANAGNKAANTGFTQGQMNQRQANNLNFQSWKYMDNKNRLIEKDQWNRQFKQLGLQVDMDQFERNFDQKERLRKSIVDIARLDRRMRTQEHSDEMAFKRANLVQQANKYATDLELNVEKFNGQMGFDLAKAQADGKLPEGFDPGSVMLQFQAAQNLNPQEIGMSNAEYQDLMDEIMTSGDMGAPKQSGVQVPWQQQQAQGQGQSQAQPMQVAPQQMPQAPAQKKGVSFKRGDLLNAAPKPGQSSMQQAPGMQQAPNPQAAQQLFRQTKRDPNELKQSVIKSLMNRGIPYAQAAQMAGGL